MRRVKVTLIYDNGARVTLRCKSFTVHTSTLTKDITRLSWTAAKPDPLHAGVDHVVAVFSRKVWRWRP